MGSDLIVCRVILILLLIKSTTCESDRLDQDACQTFISSKQVKDLIEVKRRLIPSCPCLKQQIDLDYSYEKVGHCYRSWNFEDGVKMMCCYSSDGNLFVGAPHGGYMLFEDRWRNMDDIRRSCCLEDHTCQQFYEINPSDDCSSYIPPVTVTSFGDPNIETIDGNKFDFNGHGEYVFLKTSDLEIQVRLGYVTPGNNDSTLFEAFAIFDTTSKETFEVYFNRSTKKLSVYKNATIICNSVLKGPLQPCQKPEKDHCMIQTDGNKIAIIGCGFRSFASQIVFTSGKLMDVSMTKYSSKTPINITGLAGHQHDGKFIFRNGTGVETNSTRILFDYGESWSLVNESESLFNYSLTGGNFTFYNNPHSRPRFLEHLVGNLTALFQGYPEANISLINETCRNDWDNETNEECLLTVARTKQFNLGVAVMETVNEEHRVWEILHNKPPYFLGNMTDNITAVYKQDANITIDLKQYVWDDQPVDTLRFHVETQLPAEEFSLDEGVFIWNVGTGLRYIDTSLTFFVNDSLNASAKHDVTINYCVCEKPSECDFNTENSNSSTEAIKAGCKCPDFFSGLYCETELDLCIDINCYQNNCNKTFERSSPSWPCAPCPKGREEQMIPKEQKCNDIDECTEGYGGRDKCEDICTNTDGSFICSCRSGYAININRYSCDDVDECLSVNACTGSELCVNARGSFRCVCAQGYSREISSGQCVQSGKMTLEDAVDVKCSVSNWDVSINMDVLRSLYPTTSQSSIYLGQPQCQGRLANSTLTFQYSLESCQTKEEAYGITRTYSNKLFNVIFDPIIPFLIRRHIWTFAIECDVIRGGTGTSHLHHGIESHHSTFVNRYNVTVELFKDQNFQYPLSEGSQTVHVGDDVYVKVSTSIPDWNTKMRLHTCFTNPSKNATADMDVLLIRNGCEVDTNTHIISQSTHETRFVFQDFEYVTNDEGLDIYCNATFCDSKDFSPGCVQSCYQNPTLIG